jgi:hypothetical protein
MSADDKLLAAAQSGDVAAAQAALESGADKERKDTGVRSLLQTATQHTLPALRARSRFTRRLPRAACCAQCRKTPLSWAAEKGHLGVVQLLVERGADIDTKDDVRCAAPVLPRSAAARAIRACTLPLTAVAVRRWRGSVGALVFACARFHRCCGSVSFCLAVAASARRARTDAALRGSCPEFHAALRCAALRCASPCMARTL